jgi:hypothetical protein
VLLLEDSSDCIMITGGDYRRDVGLARRALLVAKRSAKGFANGTLRVSWPVHYVSKDVADQGRAQVLDQLRVFVRENGR